MHGLCLMFTESPAGSSWPALVLKSSKTKAFFYVCKWGFFYLWMLITSNYLRLFLFYCCSCSQPLCFDLSTRLSQMALCCLIKDNVSLWDLICLLASISKPNSAIFLFSCGRSSPKCTQVHFRPHQFQILHPFKNIWECVIKSTDLMYRHFKVNKLCSWIISFASVWTCTQTLIYNWEASSRIPFRIKIFKIRD